MALTNDRHTPASPFDNKLICDLKAATNTYCLTNTQTYCAKLLSNWNSDFDKLLWQSAHRAGLTNNTCSIQLSINPMILLNFCTLLRFVIAHDALDGLKWCFVAFKLHHINCMMWNGDPVSTHRLWRILIINDNPSKQPTIQTICA